MLRRAERKPGQPGLDGGTVASAAVAVAAVGVVLPGIVAAVSLIGRHWFPSGDYAFIARRVADVGGRHTPLVGVYSRFGWDHPGPLVFWLLAPFARLGGTTGLLVGAAFINLVSLAGALATAYRRGGAALTVWVGLFLAVLCHTLGSSLLIDPWNPWLPVTGLVWFFLLAWSVACGDSAMWPWLIGVGSWEIQTHIGFAPVVGSLAVLAVIAGLAGRGWPSLRRPEHWGPSVAVALVVWAGPVAQQLTGHPGNLRAIVRYARHPSEATQGLTRAFGMAGRQLSIPPPWITGHEGNFIGILSTASVWTGLGEVALLAVLGWAAWRRGRRDAALLAATSLVAVVAGVAGLARITGLPFPYVARWMWVVALFVPLAAGWCLAGVLRPRLTPAVRAGAIGLAGLTAVVVGVSTTVAGAVPALPAQRFSDGLSIMVPATQRVIDRRLSYALEAQEPHVFGPGVGFGLQAALEARGYRVYVGPDTVLQLGSWRTTLHHRVDATISVISPADPLIPVQPPAGSRLVAHWDPLDPAERGLATALEQRIRQAAAIPPATVVDATLPFAFEDFLDHGASRADLEQLARLQRVGGEYDVYVH